MLHPETSFPANASATWEYGEEVPGMPGWIANRKGVLTMHDQDISFDVNICIGIVRLAYLHSSDDKLPRSATCWIEGPGPHRKSDEVNIYASAPVAYSKGSLSAYKEIKASLSSVATLRAAPGAC